jgi:hypothetical protein
MAPTNEKIRPNKQIDISQISAPLVSYFLKSTQAQLRRKIHVNIMFSKIVFKNKKPITVGKTRHM